MYYCRQAYLKRIIHNRELLTFSLPEGGRTVVGTHTTFNSMKYCVIAPISELMNELFPPTYFFLLVNYA